MGTAALVGPDVEAGKRVLLALDKAGVKVDAALWLLDLGADEYKYILASRLVEEVGPTATYQRIEPVLAKLPKRFRIPIWRVKVLSPSDQLIRLLRGAVRVAPPGAAGVRFTGNTIDGVLIPDAFIYRVR